MQEISLTRLRKIKKTDLYLFQLISQQRGRFLWLDRLGIFCAKYLIYVLVCSWAVFSFLSKRIDLFLIPFLSGFFSRFVLTEIIYLFNRKERPPFILGFVPLIKAPRRPSFPSGHASFFLSFSLVICYYRLELGLLFLVFGILIFLARVFAGVHWPLDIIGSFIVSIFSLGLILLFSSHLCQFLKHLY